MAPRFSLAMWPPRYATLRAPHACDARRLSRVAYTLAILSKMGPRTFETAPGAGRRLRSRARACVGTIAGDVSPRQCFRRYCRWGLVVDIETLVLFAQYLQKYGETGALLTDPSWTKNPEKAEKGESLAAMPSDSKPAPCCVAILADFLMLPDRVQSRPPSLTGAWRRALPTSRTCSSRWAPSA